MLGHVDGVWAHQWVTDTKILTETGVIKKNKLQTNYHVYIQKSLDLWIISNLADFKSNMHFFLRQERTTGPVHRKEFSPDV